MLKGVPLSLSLSLKSLPRQAFIFNKLWLAINLLLLSLSLSSGSLSLSLSLFWLSFNLRKPMSNTLEECSLLAVDCVVVCCCCPCLLLQVTVFLFIRLPQRMAVKSKKIVLRKLRKRWRKYEYVTGERERLERGEALGVQGVHDVIIEGKKSWVGDGSSFLEAEKMWEELVEKEGLFWFGSFWGSGS